MNDLIETEADIQKVELTLTNLNHDKNKFQNQLQECLITNAEFVLNSDNFITPETLIKTSFDAVDSLHNPAFLLHQSELNLLKLEKLDPEPLISFFQLKYSGKNNPIFEQIIEAAKKD